MPKKGNNCRTGDRAQLEPLERRQLLSSVAVSISFGISTNDAPAIQVTVDGSAVDPTSVAQETWDTPSTHNVTLTRVGTPPTGNDYCYNEVSVSPPWGGAGVGVRLERLDTTSQKGDYEYSSIDYTTPNEGGMVTANGAALASVGDSLSYTIQVLSGGTNLSAFFSTEPPSKMAPGDTASAAFNVSNSGSPATGSVSASFQLVPADGATNNGQPIDLGSTASASITNDVTDPDPVPVNFTILDSTPAGTYTLTGTLSDGGGITDTNKSDKTFSSAPITVTGRNNVIATSIRWNNLAGGLEITYRVDQKQTQASSVSVYFAEGVGAESELGTRVFNHVVPDGTAAGTYKVAVPSSLFKSDAPDATTNLIAVGDAGTTPASVKDVQLNPDFIKELQRPIDTRVLTPYTLRVVKDLLRQAGQGVAVVTSTIRSPEDQARIMFQNLLDGTSSKYGPAGREVVAIYRNLTKQKKPNWIKLNRDPIIAAMVARITTPDKVISSPLSVSHHIQSPAAYALYNVFDLAISSFRANAALFQRASLADSRVTRFLSRWTKPFDNAFHLEISQGAVVDALPPESDTA